MPTRLKPEDMKDEFPSADRGVDLLGQAPKPRPSFIKLRHERNEPRE